MTAAKRVFLFLLGLTFPIALAALGFVAAIEPRPALAVSAPTCCCPAIMVGGSEQYASQASCRWLDVPPPLTCAGANPGSLPPGFTYWANPDDPITFCGSQTSGGPAQSISFGLQNPLKNCTDGSDKTKCIDSPEKLVVMVAGAFVGALGVYGVVMFIYGGYMFIFSGGSSEAIQKGKGTMLWAVIGIAIGFLSVAIINFFLSRLPAAT